MNVAAVSIRSAAARDAERLAAIHDAAWREAYAGIIPGLALEKMVVRRGPVWWSGAVRRGGLLVIEIAGSLAGYASIGRARSGGDPSAGEIHELYLAPEYQGLGFGVKLFGAAAKALKARGHRRLVVRVLADNERAAAFYRRRGGRATGESEERVGEAMLKSRVYAWAL